MTIREALRSTFPFAISNRQIDVVAVARGLCVEYCFDAEVSAGKAFNLAKADIIKSIVMSPNVSEGGVSISYSEKATLISVANAIYGAYGEPIFGHEIPTVKPLDW